MESTTVKQFKDALEEMKKIYPFKDEETILCTRNFASLQHNHLAIRTKDKETGIYIEMSKSLDEVEVWKYC